ncbi:MAG TPA: enoyl-CoA hydratase-related protein [Casimicrobiaceae bacterium]
MSDDAPRTDADPILLERDGAIATLTLNRPAAMNALDVAMLDALVARTAALAADTALRVVVLRGAGQHFMAGGDLRTFATFLESASAQRQPQFQRVVERAQAAIEYLHRMPHVVIGALHGAVAGFGLSLAAACDLVVAAENAYFTSAYRQIGLTPDGGGTWSLPRAVGLRKALEIYLLSERFDAREALRIGLVSRVVPGGELDATVDQFARSIAAGPALALANVKRLLRDASERTLSEQLQAEAHSFVQCAATADFAEGIGAFLEKRRPRFSA